MSWQLTPYALAFFIAAVVAAAVAFAAWQRRAMPGGRPLALLMLAVAEWSLAAGLDVAAVGVPAKVLWSQVEYLGLVNAAPLFLIFVLEYTHRDRRLTRRNLALLWIIPLLTLLAAATNEWHHLMWTHFTPSPWGHNLLIYGHGAWFWVHVIYIYLVLLVGTLALIWAIIRFPDLYRRQAGALLTGTAIPWVGSVLYITDLNPIPGLDWTPIVFTVTGLILAWGIFRFQLLDLTPIARDALIEGMSDGVLVLDRLGRVVDINPAARRFIGPAAASAIGQRVEKVLAAWPDLAARLPDVSAPAEVLVTKDSARCYLELQASSLHDRHGRVLGRLIIGRDITARKRMEQAEREQRALAEALRDTAAVLNRTLNLDEVLDLILTQVGRVVLHDAANVMLVDAKGEGRIVRAHGYTNRGLAEEELQVRRFALADVPTWRRMVNTGRPIVVTDTARDAEWVAMPGVEWIRSYAGAPIRIKDRIVGCLSVDSVVPGFFTPADADRLQAFADQAAIAIENARLFAEIQQLSITDELTGAYNRRYFEGHLLTEFQRARRYARPLALSILDLDHFKQINDQYGHPTGDIILTEFAALVQTHVRETDIVTRYGGEEFAVILPETNLAQAIEVVERVQATMAAHCFTCEAHEFRITFSAGVAALPDQSPPDCQALVRLADQALIRAKQEGRNRVCAA